MDPVTLSASPRTALGKKNRALRRDGQVPVHLYGLTAAPESLQASLGDVRTVLRNAGYTSPVVITVNGQETVALVRSIARHPVTSDLQHVDLLRVDREKPVVVPVPVKLINASSAPGTRGGAGAVTQGLYTATVSAKPFDVPTEIVVDCMVLVAFDSVIKVSDLKLPAGVTVAGNLNAQVVWIQAPRVTKVETPVAAAEGEAAVAGAEGAAAAPAAASAKGAAPAAGAKAAAPAAAGKAAPAAAAKK